MEDSTNIRAGETKKPSVVVIEATRYMQALYRSMLSGDSITRVRVFGNSSEALPSIMSDPPDVLVVEWNPETQHGDHFLDRFRSRQLYPICLLPVIMIMSEVRHRCFERAIRLGAHAVLAKPVSTTRLFDYILWVSRAERVMELVGDRYVCPELIERIEKPTFDTRQVEAHLSASGEPPDLDRIFRSAFY